MIEYFLGEDAARFSVVSFARDAMTRVPWSYNEIEINAGIDQMTAGGSTSISDGIARARQLFADNGRAGATKIILLLSDGEQTTDAAPGKTRAQTAIDAAALAKADGITVFAWGFGGVSLGTLQQIATDPSKAFLANDLAGLSAHLAVLQAVLCNESPPLLPPSPPPLPSQPPYPPASPPPAPSPHTNTFTSTDALKTAVQAVNANPASAIATYGPVADWDVSGVSDMSFLFYNLQNFDTDVSSWDTSSVTDMSYMFRVRSAHALAPPASTAGLSRRACRS